MPRPDIYDAINMLVSTIALNYAGVSTIAG
jgi:hypothetical protein